MAKKQVPETSLDAYRSLDPDQIRDIYKRILWALSQISEGTYEMIAVSLKEKESRIWKRLNEMQKMGLIYRTENKKALSSGRMGYTWKRTLEQTETIQEHSRKIQDISKQAEKYKPQTLF